MTASPLVIDRRLAIHLLHVAQVAAPAAIDGMVVCDAAGEPQRFLPLEQAEQQPATALWAKLYSNPTAAAVPSTAEMHPTLLTLVISLNTKGVLEMRAWTLQHGAPLERAVSIIE